MCPQQVQKMKAEEEVVVPEKALQGQNGIKAKVLAAGLVNKDPHTLMHTMSISLRNFLQLPLRPHNGDVAKFLQWRN